MKVFTGLSNISIFVKSFIFSILGISLAYFLFRIETGIVSIFLITLSLIWAASFLFERNSREIWEKIATPYKANTKLAFSLLCIFFGILLGYGFFVLFTKISIVKELLAMQLGIYREIKVSIKDIDFGNFKTILINNFTVLIIVFFISLIYRLGGVLLVIVWNASVWGSVFFYIIKSTCGTAQMNPIYYFLTTILCISPHLFTEALGYILCSMSGFFISKSLTKYEIGSDQFLRVSKASLAILGISLGFIVLSAYLESNLAPKLISIFLGNL